MSLRTDRTIGYLGTANVPPMLRLLLPLLILSASLATQAQSVFLRDGHAYWVVNAPGLSFHLRVEGDSVQAMENGAFLLVDGQIMQLSIFHREAFNGGPGPLELLGAYYDYERAYIRSLMGDELQFRDQIHRLGNGTVTIFWHFDMPDLPDADTLDTRAVEQLLLSMACNDYMVGLSMPRLSDQEHAVLRDRLFAIANTLTLYDAEITLEQVQALD